MTRFDQDHDELRGLNELVRIERPCPEVQFGNATRDEVIDIAAVIGLQNFLRGPGRLWRIGAPPHGWPPGFWYTNPLVGFLPSSNSVTARLPNSRQIWLSVRRARYGLGRRVCRGQENCQRSVNAREKVMSHVASPHHWITSLHGDGRGIAAITLAGRRSGLQYLSALRERHIS